MSEQEDIHQQVEKFCFQATEAINSNNLKLAFEFVGKAKGCLPLDSWTNESFYEQALNVNLLFAECEYVSGNHSTAIEIYQGILPNIVDNVDRLKVRFLLLKSSSASAKYEIMYDEFIDLLASNPSTHCLVANGDTFTEKWIESTTMQIKESIESYSSLNDILEMKECEDEESVAFARCLLECIQGVYIGKNSNKIFLFVTPLLLFKSMLEDGLYVDLTHTIFAALGWQLSYLDDPKLGCELSDVGCALASEHHSTEANYALTKFFELCITACKFGLDEIFKVSYEAFRTAEQVEEVSWGAQSGFWLGLTVILYGVDKESTVSYLEEIKTFNRKYSREHENDLLTCIEQISLLLYGESEGFSPCFMIDGFEEITFSRLIVFFTKALIHFFKGEFQEAAEQINEADDVIDDCFGTPIYMLYKWFSFIILSAFYEKHDDNSSKNNQKKSKLSIMEVMLGPNAKAPKTMKEKTMERILEHEKDIIDLHAKYPMFMDAAKAMCAAEVAKINGGEPFDVIQLYLIASSIAVRQNLHFYAAIIQSRLADFCLSSQSDSKMVKKYAEEAIASWEFCNAQLMTTSLTEKFKEVLSLRDSDEESLVAQVPNDSIILSDIFIHQSTNLLSFSNAERLGVIVKEPNCSDFKLVCEKEKGRETEVFEDLDLSQADFKFSVNAANMAMTGKTPVIISNLGGSDMTRNQMSDCEYLQHNPSVKEIMVIPVSCGNMVRGCLVFETSDEGSFTRASSKQLKILVDIVVGGVSTQHEQLTNLRKFTPVEVVKQLGKDITTVGLGDSVSKRVSLVNLEMRNLLEIIEVSNTNSGLSFLNSFIGAISPIVSHYGGFIERSTGSKFCAVFTEPIQKAVLASLEIVKAVREFNKDLTQKGSKVVPSIGIGVHLGSCTMGVIGTVNQFQTTIFSETYSLCSEITKLTNSLGAIVVASQDVIDSINTNELKLKTRKLGKFLFGNNKKRAPMSLFEISTSDWVEYNNDLSKNISQQVEECIELFSKKKFDKVISITEGLEKTIKDKFENNPSILGSVPHLKLIQLYKDQSKRNMSVTSLLGDWNGEISVDHSGNPQHLFEPSVKSEQVLVTPKSNEANDQVEKKLRSLQTQIEQLKSENENLRSYIKSEETGMSCFCVPSRKKVHPSNK